MYIYMLWMRYLKARRQAYICIICVMLGVATLIVVNSVMSGFSTKLRDGLNMTIAHFRKVVADEPAPESTVESAPSSPVLT